MKRLLLPVLMVFAIAALLVGTAPANAGFVMTLDDLAIPGGAEIIIADGQGVGFVTASGLTTTVADNNLVSPDGVISYNGAVAGSVWGVNVTTGISKPVVGGSGLAIMDLNSVNVSSGGAGTLELMLTDTDFNLVGLPSANLYSRIGGTTMGMVEQDQIYDPDNVEFGSGVLVNQGPFGPGAFSGTASALIDPLVNPFSLTEVITITHTGSGQITSFDSESSVVPEPGSMLLIGTGLIGLAGLGRRKLRKK